MITPLTRTTAAVAIAAALGAGASALPASGRGGQDPTLTFTTTQKPGDERYVDLAPKGESVGDRFAVSSTIHLGGRPAGRVEADCVALDRRYQGFSCSGTALLPKGSIAFQGTSANKPLPGGVHARKAVFAITGGTGAYSGAGGTATRTGNGKVDRFVLILAD